jgi:trehalose 6-phosphate phosphatase
VRVSQELTALLARLQQRLDGRVAILTGRSAAEIDRYLSPVALAVGGHHGLERRSLDQPHRIMERPAGLDLVISQLRRLERDYPGVLVEDKPLGVALHFRQAPDAEEACRRAIEDAARHSGLEVQPGKMVFELKPRGANKGDALKAMMAEPLFVGSLPLVLGDDLTDEPAFEAAQDMGGAGIIVGDRAPTRAQFRIGSVDKALAWLRQSCELA